MLLPPLLGRAVRARVDEAVQHREVDRGLDIELELAVAEHLADALADAELFPQAVENEVRAYLPRRHGLERAALVVADDRQLRGEPRAGGEQAVELTRVLERLEAADRGDDALLDAPLVAERLDDLEVLARAITLCAEEHGQ